MNSVQVAEPTSRSRFRVRADVSLSARVRYGIDLTRHLVAREFRLRYRRAFFGWVWAVAQPLLRFAVFNFVFSSILKTSIKDFPSYLFSGIVIWSWFSSGVLSAIDSVHHRGDLLYRSGLPRLVIPITSVLTDLLDLLCSLPVLAFILAITGKSVSGWLLFIPIILAVEFLIICSVGMLFCIANVYFRDVRLVIEVLLLFWMYLTPMFYRAEQVPHSFRRIVDWNPVSIVLRSFRSIVLNGTFSNIGQFAFIALLSIVVFALSATLFTRKSASFVDEL